MIIGIDARLWSESGVGRYIRNLVRGIEKKNTSHKFIIFLNSENFGKVDFENSNFKKVRADSRWHTLSEQWEFKKVIEKEKPDLMHFPYFSYPVFYKGPFVITIHDLIIDHYPTGMASSLPLPLYYLKYYAYRDIIRRAVKNARKIIAPSHATKQELADHYHVEESKVEVIYEGFDPLISGKNKSAPLVSKKFILYVGNAYPHKNIERLIQAHQLIYRDKDIELVCIGRSDFFYTKIEEKKYQGVHFLHSIDDCSLFDYYTHAKMLVMPTLMEGFGLPVLEAMSLSCPVICSDTPVLREIGGDAVTYFDPKNVDSIASTMSNMLENNDLSQEYAARGLTQAKRFSWDRCINETIKVYESSNSV